MDHIRSAEGLFFEHDNAYNSELPVFYRILSNGCANSSTGAKGVNELQENDLDCWPADGGRAVGGQV
jgi:hypothetical protein